MNNKRKSILENEMRKILEDFKNRSPNRSQKTKHSFNQEEKFVI